MGVFDLRCALSGLSTLGPGNSACSMLLLEEVDGLQVPVLVPLSGTYDRYGSIDGDNAWLGAILEEWWEAERLTTRYRDLLDHSEYHFPAKLFSLAADSIFNDYDLTLDGARVQPCIYRNDVAAALLAGVTISDDETRLLGMLGDDASFAVYADWLEQAGRPIQAAYERRHFVREIQLEDADELRALIRYLEPRGGFSPISLTEGAQHSDENLDRFAQAAWDAGEPAIRSLLQRWLDEQSAEAQLTEASVERRYAALPVTLDMVSAIVKSPAIVAAIDHSPDRTRVLEILRAPRPTDVAVLAEIDGIVSIDGDEITIAADDCTTTQQLAGRTPIVAPGATVVAGAPLTAGSLDDLHQQLRIFGSLHVRNHIVESLRPLLDLDQANLELLVNPMFEHDMLEKSGHRVTRDQAFAWGDAGHFFGGKQLLSSYAALATHRDPALGVVVAEVERREEARSRGRQYRLRLRT